MKVTRGRWHWNPRPGSFVDIDLTMINRPHFSLLGQEEDNRAVVGVSWGNGNSDPVWLIDVRIPVPRCIGSRLEW